MTSVIVARATDDILQGSTVSGTAPLASYDLNTLLTRNPAARVRFVGGTLTITFTLPAPAQGDVLVIPVSNLDTGDTVLHLTNDVGLDVAIYIPAARKNGIPRTVAVDLTALEPTTLTRTSDSWSLEITANSVPVTLGGAVAIFGPKRTLEAMQWGLSLSKQQFADVVVNDYGVTYRTNRATMGRSFDCVASAEPDELADLEDWYDDCAGVVDPGLLWIQRDELEPVYGTWQEAFKAQQAQGSFLYDVTLQFSELSKGKPV